MLEVEPDRADLHDNAALIYLWLGETDRAIAHLRESVHIKPNFAPARYNLGTALIIAGGRLEEALTQLRRALEIQPDYVLAHLNLGAVLRSHKGLRQLWKRIALPLRPWPHLVSLIKLL
jgi:tetratricopeptide (TPR) repeat protein